jgi:uncharacterized phage-associated protein
MIIKNNEKKLINAIKYFAENTNMCGKTKLFKLLYFLDFKHYMLTARSVTGLQYYAWKLGPVPRELFQTIDTPNPSFKEELAFTQRKLPSGKRMLSIKVKREFESSIFSKRELKLLETLAVEYKDTTADDMVEATHLENHPWDKIYNQKRKRLAKIPYDMAIRTSEAELISVMSKENQEVHSNYNASR